MIHSSILSMADSVCVTSGGHLGEIGVFKGDSIVALSKIATKHGRRLWAFDSFVGMDEPGEHDDKNYPRGKFNVGGRKAWEESVTKRMERDTDLHIGEGYIPVCFQPAMTESFCFLYIDVDHYQPTVDAIEWAWPRIMPGGILAFHDYWPDRDRLASKAINEWVATDPGETLHVHPIELVVRKPR